jgi:plastocyanin
MGIVMAWLAPTGTPGLDPFSPAVHIEEGLNTRALYPPTTPGYTLPGANLPACTPSDTTLCVRGQATHSRIPTSGDHWACQYNACPNIARGARDGQLVTDIHLAGFTFGEADFGVIPATGIPLVKKGTPVTFTNADTADYMWHTVTRCANPCSGTTSASYPVANGAWDDIVAPAPPSITDPDARDAYVQNEITQYIHDNGPDLAMDFDSGQIGVGTGANNKLSWTYSFSRTGTYTFFCRIHPSMRGAIRVVN